MKYNLLKCLVCLVPAVAFAAKIAMPQGPTNILCPSASIAELETFGTTGEWVRHIDPEPGGWAFRSPTKTFGQWIELRISPKGLTEILVTRAGDSKVLRLDRSCVKKSAAVDLFPVRHSEHDFTDKDLEKLIGSKRSGLIYVWHPGMIYSVKHFGQFRDLCKKLGLDFIPVANFNGDYASLEETSKKFNLPASPKLMASVELFMRGIQHHPTSYVFADGKLSLSPILGVKQNPELTRVIAESLARLSNAN